MTLYHPRPERWPQVSLRGFFVLVTVLCVGLGWLGVQMKWIHDRHQALTVWETSQEMDDPYDPFFLTDDGPWSLTLLGEQGISRIFVERNQVSEAKRLFPEARIEVRGATP